MEDKSRLFLETLIKTPSPSGDEAGIQQVVIDYMKPFAEAIKTDAAGNVIGILNESAPFKIMLAGHCDEIAYMVQHIDGNGFIYLQKAGGINPKLALGAKVRIFTKQGVIKGVIGAPAEHHGGAKGEVTLSSICVDCGAKDKEEMSKIVSVGDYVLYDTDYEYLLNNRLTGRGLDNRTGAFIVTEVLRKLKDAKLNVGVYAVTTVNEETNMGGAYFAAQGIKPNVGIACDVTFATDYDGVNPKEHGDVKVGGGPVLAKGAPINKKVNHLLEDAAERLKMKVQYELTPKSTGTDADKIRLTGDGVPVALVSLPLRYMHSPVELVSLDDIEEEIDLLVEMIKNLQGNENLKPVTV